MISRINSVFPTQAGVSNAGPYARFMRQYTNYMDARDAADNSVVPQASAFDALPKGPLKQAIVSPHYIGPHVMSLYRSMRAPKGGPAHSHGAAWRAPSQIAAEPPPIASMMHGPDTIEAIHQEVTADNPVQADAARRTRITDGPADSSKKVQAQPASTPARETNADFTGIALRAQARAFATIPGLESFKNFYLPFKGPYAA